VTLIEREAVERAAADYDLDLDPAETRRNLLTRAVPLNHLVDREFRVGEALLVGRQLCEPCGYMESLAEVEGAERALVHRGGLEADIVESGEIAVGDAVEF
jgi:MOSC domain-containing protein YiiM